MEELVRKSDVRKALLSDCSNLALAIEEIEPVDAVLPTEALLVERVVNHAFPSHTVLECSACMSYGESYHRFCHMCGARFKEVQYVRNV